MGVLGIVGGNDRSDVRCDDHIQVAGVLDGRGVDRNSGQLREQEMLDLCLVEWCFSMSIYLITVRDLALRSQAGSMVKMIAVLHLCVQNRLV